MGIKFSSEVSSASPKKLFLFGAGTLIAAIVLLFFSYKQYDETKDYKKISGIVVDYDSRYSDGSTLYAEVVEYAVDGRTYECVCNSYSSIPKSIGDKATVKYNEKNPSKCQVDQKAWDIIMFAVGVIFAVVSGVLWFKFLKGRDNEVEEG